MASEPVRERLEHEVWAGVEEKEIEAGRDGGNVGSKGDEAIEVGRDVGGVDAEGVDVNVDVGSSMSSVSSRKTPESRSRALGSCSSILNCEGVEAGKPVIISI